MQNAFNSECAIVMLVNKAECMNSFTPGTQICIKRFDYKRSVLNTGQNI